MLVYTCEYLCGNLYIQPVPFQLFSTSTSSLTLRSLVAELPTGTDIGSVSVNVWERINDGFRFATETESEVETAIEVEKALTSDGLHFDSECLPFLTAQTETWWLIGALM